MNTKIRIWNKKPKKFMLRFPGDQKYNDVTNLLNSNSTFVYGQEIGTDCVVEFALGSRDIKGQDIFEGDIVKILQSNEFCEHELPLIGVIKYDYKEAAFCRVFYENGKEKKDRYGDVSDFFNWEESVEVIGNIHENSKLLVDK